jgi:hypothetical protein
MSAADAIKGLANDFAYSSVHFAMGPDKYTRQQRDDDRAELHAAIDAFQSEMDELLGALTPLLRAASQASFALRELVPDHPDAKMTNRMLAEAISTAAIRRIKAAEVSG